MSEKSSKNQTKTGHYVPGISYITQYGDTVRTINAADLNRPQKYQYIEFRTHAGDNKPTEYIAVEPEHPASGISFPLNINKDDYQYIDENGNLQFWQDYYNADSTKVADLMNKYYPIVINQQPTIDVSKMNPVKSIIYGIAGYHRYGGPLNYMNYLQ